MESNIPSEIASTLQGASIKRHPSPRHDLNPSTAASEKQPVALDRHPDLDADSDIAEDEIPISVLNPVPRKQNMPPLPDLRFEQSYLKSIEQAESWQGVLWITLKDQVSRRMVHVTSTQTYPSRSFSASRKACSGPSCSAGGGIGTDRPSSADRAWAQGYGAGGGA
jgi:hypothetical protein